jgi:tRNA(fMet)-specific endonuclease VapC
MRFLLDTNVCIAVLRNRPERVADRVEEHDISDLAVSSITVAELRYGA